MTKLQRVLASLALLTVALGAGAPAFAAEKVTFLIDWLPAGDKAVPYLVALHRGFDSLNVT